MVETTYLDHNATTPARPEVITAVGEIMALTGANPSSVYGYGRDARKRIENARMNVAALVNAKSSEVIFTGGGSGGRQSGNYGFGPQASDDRGNRALGGVKNGFTSDW